MHLIPRHYSIDLSRSGRGFQAAVSRSRPGLFLLPWSRESWSTLSFYDECPFSVSQALNAQLSFLTA